MSALTEFWTRKHLAMGAKLRKAGLKLNRLPKLSEFNLSRSSSSFDPKTDYEMSLAYYMGRVTL